MCSAQLCVVFCVHVEAQLSCVKNAEGRLLSDSADLKIAFFKVQVLSSTQFSCLNALPLPFIMDLVYRSSKAGSLFFPA